jgi:hypothetical protein
VDVLPDVNEYGHVLISTVAGGGIGDDIISSGSPVNFKVAATKDYWAFDRFTDLELPVDAEAVKAACTKKAAGEEEEEEEHVDPIRLVDETCSNLESILPSAESRGELGTPLKWGDVAFLTAAKTKMQATGFVLEPCEV